MRPDHAALIEQGQAARHFEHALDHEHDVGPAGVIFVEAERDIVLQRPGQNAVAEFGDLLAVLDDDGVLADEIDARDMAVEVDAHAGPVEPRGDLLDMRRFAGAVIARHHHAAVLGEAGENGERRVAIEQIIGIEVGHMFLGGGIGGRPPCRNRSRKPGAPKFSCRAGRRSLRRRRCVALCIHPPLRWARFAQRFRGRAQVLANRLRSGELGPISDIYRRG